MIFTWLPLDLPHPPAKFIALATELGHNMANNHKNIKNTALNQNDNGYADRLLLKDGKEIKSRIQYGYELGKEWETWVKENIIENFHMTGGRYSYGEDTTTHGPHSDTVFKDTWTYKLYYLLDPGGPDVKTIFFQEHGQPIMRRGTKENICHCDDYSKLDTIDELKFPMGRWVLLNTSVLHGVENVTGTRLNLVVIFNTNDITKVLSDLYKKFDK